jgi:tetratricopeptide (TPR) repeat protein
MLQSPHRTPSLDVASELAQAVALQQQGRLAEAEQRYGAILAAVPAQADALHYLGLIKLATGRFGEALHSIAAAMRAGPPSPEVLLHYGLVLNALDRPAEAVESFDKAIALDPLFAQAYNDRAVLLAAMGRRNEALESYRQALAIKPDDPGVHFNHGNLLMDLGRTEEALACYDRALALRPAYPEALCNRGVVLHSLTQHSEAVASFDRAIALQADIPEAHSNRGNALKALKRFAEALASYDRAIGLRPTYAEALCNRGTVLHEMKRYDEAVDSFRRALGLQPDYATAHSNLGATLHELGRYDEALACYDRALAIMPDYAEGLCNRGAALSELMRHKEALANYERARALQPDLPEAHWNEASLRLLTGDFARGWEEYEWRWKRESFARTVRDFRQPLWRGSEPLEGKTILLHSEQGFGDSIQFCRYVPRIAARGARVLLEVERPLQRLMRGLAGVAEVIVKGDALPDFDLHCPLLTLPRGFATALATIPWDGPYLQTASAEVAAWEERLGPRPRIGLAWSGNAAHQRDHRRSIPLRTLLPLLDIDATFVCLQKDVRAGDAAELNRRDDIRQFALGDFADTAALVATLDLVITVDTSIAHLAGALGRPVWILVSYVPDWRWLLERDSSPWYPSARLFRQNTERDWREVIARVHDAGRALFGHAKPTDFK